MRNARVRKDAVDVDVDDVVVDESSVGKKDAGPDA
jgi:hypothetical protein